MPWTATVVSTSENPVPGDSINVVVRYTNGPKTFDRTYKVTNAERFEAFLVDELRRVEANYAALQQLPDVSDQAVPHRVENFQFRVILRQRGSYGAVNTFLTDAARPRVVLEAWERANYFYRNGGIISLLRSQFNISDADLDQIFIDAAAIEP